MSQALPILLHPKTRPDMYQRWVWGLREVGLNDSEIAAVLDVETDVIKALHSGMREPDRDQKTVLKNLSGIVRDLLLEGCTKEDVVYWLLTPEHFRLDEERPIDLIRESPGRVRAAACEHALARMTTPSD